MGRPHGGPAGPLGDDLVKAGPAADPAAIGQRRTGQKIAGLRTVDVPLERLLVVQPADEQQLFAEVGQRLQHGTEFHLLPCAFRPPMARVKAAAGKQHRQPDGSLTCRLALLPRGFIAPHRERLHPRQRHADAETSEHCSSGQVMGHLKLPFVFRVTRIRDRQALDLPPQILQTQAGPTCGRCPGYGRNDFPRIIRNCLLNTIVSTATEKRYSFFFKRASILSISGRSESCSSRPMA